MRTESAHLSSLIRPDYPLSNKYDPAWVVENQMGPHPLWLTESLCRHVRLAPGMRVLDMGCGRAITSIFLAREFRVRVWANDWWIKPSDNWTRIRKAGLQDSVFPIHAEARSLPYGDEFFDCLLSVDAYHYFGTDDLYFREHFARRVKVGGQIGIVVPGLVRVFDDGEIPPHLKQIWADDFNSFHTADWWRRHWEVTGRVEIEVADVLRDGWRDWLVFNEALDALRGSPSGETDLLRQDGGRYLGFVRLVVRRIR